MKANLKIRAFLMMALFATVTVPRAEPIYNGRAAVDPALAEEIFNMVSGEGKTACANRLTSSKCNSLERCIRTMGALRLYGYDPEGVSNALVQYTRASKMQCACVRSFLGNRFDAFLNDTGQTSGDEVYNCWGR